MLEQLFRFPVALVDGDNEERKMRAKRDMGDLPNQPSEFEEFDIIFGEAEYPYWDVIGIEDRWLPTTESFNKAMAGEFEACLVRFMHVGQVLVPWSKKKFKANLNKFAAEYDLAHPPKEQKVLKIKTLTEEEARKILGEDGEDIE